MFLDLYEHIILEDKPDPESLFTSASPNEVLSRFASVQRDSRIYTFRKFLEDRFNIRFSSEDLGNLSNDDAWNRLIQDPSVLTRIKNWYRLRMKARKRIRQELGSTGNQPIVVVDGDSPPEEAGEGWYYMTAGGTRIRHPSAYSKVGWSNMRYNHSTKRIVVGINWVRANLPEDQAKALTSPVEI